MSVIYILLPLAVILASIALLAFIRSVKAGQFDDLDTPAHRILHDDEDEGAACPRTDFADSAPPIASRTPGAASRVGPDRLTTVTSETKH